MLTLLIVLLVLCAAGGLGWPAYSGTPYNSPVALVLWVFVILLMVSLLVGPWHHALVL